MIENTCGECVYQTILAAWRPVSNGKWREDVYLGCIRDKRPALSDCPSCDWFLDDDLRKDGVELP